METVKIKKFIKGEVREIPEDVDESRTITFVISDSSRDRHKSVVDINRWNIDEFNRNGIIGYQHDVHGGGMCLKADPDDVIGSGRAYFGEVEGERVLLCDVTFEPKEINKRADKIFQKVKLGTLKATSVGFLPISDENGEIGQYGYIDKEGNLQDKETFYYHGQELIELSIVNIGSNRNALKRDLRDQTANALQYVKRELGISYGEIEDMTVRDVIDMLENPEERKNSHELTYTIDVDSKVAQEAINKKIEEIKSECKKTNQVQIKENDSTESEPDVREGQRHNRIKARALKLQSKIQER